MLTTVAPSRKTAAAAAAAAKVAKSSLHHGGTVAYVRRGCDLLSPAEAGE